MIETVDRALRVLELLGEEPKTLEQLSKPLGVHKSTVLRVLQTMEARGFVSRFERNRFGLGSAVYHLASEGMAQHHVIGMARPHLIRLNYRTSQAVLLAVMENDQVIFVDLVEAKHNLQVRTAIGISVPLHASAAAKVLMAAVPKHTRLGWLRELEYTPFTPATLKDATDYASELDRVIECGYALERGEQEPFINGLAAPIRDATGKIVAAVSILVPAPVLPYADLLELIPDLLATADQITAEYTAARSP